MQHPAVDFDSELERFTSAVADLSNINVVQQMYAQAMWLDTAIFLDAEQRREAHLAAIHGVGALSFDRPSGWGYSRASACAFSLQHARHAHFRMQGIMCYDCMDLK